MLKMAHLLFKIGTDQHAPTQPGTPRTACMQVVHFTELIQVCHQLASGLLVSSSFIKLPEQLASSLLTTCSRLAIIKPKKAMGTHSGICLIALAQVFCKWLTGLLQVDF